MSILYINFRPIWNKLNNFLGILHSFILLEMYFKDIYIRMYLNN